jgi:hypothetical protein
MKITQMKIITSININATAEKVWRILTDIENYSQWNLFITSINGEIEVGNTLDVMIVPPNGKTMKFKPTVLVVDKHKELKWKGKLLFKGLFDGEHKFEIVDNKNGTVTFIQSENFIGVLVPFFKKMINVNTKNGFVLMNERLREKAEDEA